MVDYCYSPGPVAESRDTDAFENNANGDDVMVKTSTTTVPYSARYLVLSFVRHAECASNVRQHCGEFDPLTERGREQAKILGKQWADVRIDQLWASSLERAYATADILSQHNKGHPKMSRFDCIQERLDRAIATRDGNYAVKLALKNHGVNLREDPLPDWEENSTASLPDGVPHVVFVSHGGFLSHLCESLYSKEDGHWRKWNYDNSGWTRHLLWHDEGTDKLGIKLLFGKGVNYHSSPFSSSLHTTVYPKSNLNPVRRDHSECQGNGTSIDLAAEVVDMIIDHLHDCKPALQSCALVSRAWLPASRFHLFHNIQLHPGMGLRRYPRHCENLYSIVQRSPHILALIRDLHIMEGKYERTEGWVNDTPCLVLILNSLTHLNTLHLQCFNWIRLKPELRGALRHALASNPLSNLKFQQCTFLFTSLLSIFNLCSRSISLTLSSVVLDTSLEAAALAIEEEAGYMGLENKCRFQALRIPGCPLEIQSWLSGSSGPDLSHLHTFYCDWYDPNMALLHQLGGHLQHLSLRAAFQMLSDREDGPLLGNLTGLPSLEVAHIAIGAGSIFNYAGPSWLLQLLQSVQSATYLHHIKLMIIADGESVHYDAWAAIDDTLVGDAFPALMRVEVNLESSRYGVTPSQDKLKSLFPRLEKRRLLDICEDPWSRFE